MRVGHLDGKGAVYDGEGKPILLAGESLLCHVPKDNIDVSEGSSLWNMKTLFAATGEKGDLYVTDRRLLFIRKPDASLAFRSYNYPGGIPDALAAAYKASSLYRHQAREFCEIRYGEIEGFWVRKRKAGVLYLQSSGSVTRKVLLASTGATDKKFLCLRNALSQHLPVTQAEDDKGNFGMGRRYPFLHRGRKHDS